ncbi:hypothetical protein [Paenibacillus sp. KN14-4R]|uniref:hypothetical protein n=1 Tax=Paenibacillus sp. KN14-4R TaxID=3445773 RepID=UPI003FA14C35
MKVYKFKKSMILTLMIMCLFLALPMSAFASGGIVGRTTNNVSYKAAQFYFKMPDSMSLTSGTYPSLFYTVDTNASDGYYNLDFGLQYYDGGFRFQYFGGSNSKDGNVARVGTSSSNYPKFTTWSSKYGSSSCNVGDTSTGCASGTSGQSPIVLDYVPSQQIRMDINFVTQSGTTGGSALEIDIYDGSTFLAQAVLPVKDQYKNSALTNGARFNQQFNMVTNQSNPVNYYKNGSYAFNAKFLDSYVITTSGTWVKLNNTNSSNHVLFEGYESVSTSGKISYWGESVNGFTYDNIGYDFRP